VKALGLDELRPLDQKIAEVLGGVGPALLALA